MSTFKLPLQQIAILETDIHFCLQFCLWVDTRDKSRDSCWILSLETPSRATGQQEDLGASNSNPTVSSGRQLASGLTHKRSAKYVASIVALTVPGYPFFPSARGIARCTPYSRRVLSEKIEKTTGSTNLISVKICNMGWCLPILSLVSTAFPRQMSLKQTYNMFGL